MKKYILCDYFCKEYIEWSRIEIYRFLENYWKKTFNNTVTVKNQKQLEELGFHLEKRIN